ncbi:UNVERIFIED_CONTAM: Transposon Ty3-G Gag-Pol polyprotein [Sesamum radiatum]|uniref:Transposon Ty3-G Gag-Pol polyprotein n=1 Tax=Sesamum radiatum TaxID=300843 RepID=A0AAW2R2B2_SESRA
MPRSDYRDTRGTEICSCECGTRPCYCAATTSEHNRAVTNYNKNKSILGEGLTASMDKGSSSRITTTILLEMRPQINRTQGAIMLFIGWSFHSSMGKMQELGLEDVQGHKCKVMYSYMLMNEEEVQAYEEENEQVEEQGIVNGKEIHILIDSGSTHSFIDEKVAKALGIKTKLTTPMIVSVADGYRMMSKVICPELSWEIQGAHNPVELDFHQLTVTISQKDGKVILRALPQKNGSMLITPDSLSGLLGRKTYNLFGQMLSAETLKDKPMDNPIISGLLLRFDDIFQEPQSLPPRRAIEHRIELLPDAIPKKQQPYRYAYGQKTEIENIVRGMLKSGIIRKSQSSFASPVLLVKKKDGGWRLCVDYRYLNQLTVKHNFPIPVIDELLDELHGAKYFSKIDLRSGYFQIRMREEDISKTSFITHSGHYEFLVMPFGLCNAPSTFQAMMNQIFEPFLRKFVLVFFDDILIYSKGWTDHLQHLRIVLELLRTHKLYAKKSKCSFAQQQVEYLGHVISVEGVSTDPQKVQCMKNWPAPTTVKALRGFLGLTGYYRKFIKGYGVISKPLTTLLKKDGFLWNEEAEIAFNKLKEVMCTAPVLALPDFTKPFVVETDACGKGIGAVLMQEGRPIAYLSKALAAKNLGLSTYEKEFLALLLSVTKWKHYLQCHHFIIRTDQKSLKHILDQRVDSVLQQKWITKLLGLSYEVQYKKGNENRAADALSRREPDQCQTYGISTQLPLWMQELQTSYEGDTLFQSVLQAKILDPQSHPEYQYESGVLRKGNKLCVGSHGGIRERIIKVMHDSALGGHSGITGTLQRLKMLFYWPTAKEEVQTWVKECETCQRSKHENNAYPGLLQPLPIPEQAWFCISMDFIEGLPQSYGKDSILVVVDRLTKYSHFIPLKHPYTAASIAKIFFDNIYKLHGLPVSIVSDRDRVFTSNFWRELFGLTGVSLDMSSAYHPQTYGQTERINQCLENYLRCMCH